MSKNYYSGEGTVITDTLGVKVGTKVHYTAWRERKILTRPSLKIKPEFILRVTIYCKRADLEINTINTNLRCSAFISQGSDILDKYDTEVSTAFEDIGLNSILVNGEADAEMAALLYK